MMKVNRRSKGRIFGVFGLILSGSIFLVLNAQETSIVSFNDETQITAVADSDISGQFEADFGRGSEMFEPGRLALLGIGLLGLAFGIRKASQKS